MFKGGLHKLLVVILCCDGHLPMAYNTPNYFRGLVSWAPDGSVLLFATLLVDLYCI